MSTPSNISVTTEDYLNQTITNMLVITGEFLNQNDVITTNSTSVTHAPAGPATGSWTTVTSYIIVPLLVVLGCFGNTFTIIVMRSKRFQHSSTGVYLTALALSDMAFLLTFPIAKGAFIDLFDKDIRALSVTGCRLYFFMFRGTKISSSWYVVLVGIERFLVVWFPFKAKILSNKRIALISTIVATTAIFTFEAARTGNTNIINGMCMPFYKTPETEKLQTAFVATSTTIYSLIPTAILITVTPLTVWKLVRQQKKRQELTQNTSGNDETLHVTVMLLSVTIAYLTLVTVISMAHAVAFFMGEVLVLSKDPKIIVFLEIAQIMEQLNYVINFFLYVISNVAFRKHVIFMLKCQCLTDKFQSIAAKKRHETAENSSCVSANKESSQSSSTQMTDTLSI